MLAFTLYAIAVLQSAAEKVGLEGWVPNNLVGVLTAISVGGLLVEKLVNRGKKQGVDESTVNGLGSRITNVEQNHTKLEGQFAEHQRSVDRVLVQNEGILREIGKAERSVTQCQDDTEKFSIEIGGKVDTMRRDVMAELQAARREFAERTGKIEVGLAEVKREVELRAEFENRERPR